jgi:hypothetical protein
MTNTTFSMTWFWQILEYHPQMLKECLSGTDQTNFLYPRHDITQFHMANVFVKKLEVAELCLTKCSFSFHNKQCGWAVQPAICHLEKHYGKGGECSWVTTCFSTKVRHIRYSLISLLVQCHSRKAKTKIRGCRAYVCTHSIEGLAFDIVSSHDLIT